MEVFGADINGIEGQLIRFEATKDEKRQGVTLLGLAQRVVKEGYVRASKAIETLEGPWSNILDKQGYTISLHPAETPKKSAGLDLPIAVMLLLASILQNLDALQTQIERLEERLKKSDGEETRGERRKRILEERQKLIDQRELTLKYRKRLAGHKKKYLLIGQLSITDGRIVPPEFGMFSMVAAAKPGFTVIVPEESETHAAIAATRNSSVRVLKAANLQEVWNVLLGHGSRRASNKALRKRPMLGTRRHIPDFRDIEGVSRAKRAMTIALAGGHNILLVGPPGHGKTMLSMAATNLLPPLTRDEMFELNKIYSARGDLRNNEVVNQRPFQEVQATATEAALFGGGRHLPRPGLISLAHNGVLFFDEINLHKPRTIEELRNTLNYRVHTVQRAQGNIEYPCRFILVAAMNPCKCGWYAHYICPGCRRTFFSRTDKCERHPGKALEPKCKCSQQEVNAYRSKLSAPLLQRIDLKVLVSSHDKSQIDEKAYASSSIKRQIRLAREVQEERYEEARFGNRNADVPDEAQARKYMPPVPDRVAHYLDELYRQLDLSKRTEVKVVLVARTIADYEESRVVRVKDVMKAVDLMGLTHDYFKRMGY